MINYNEQKIELKGVPNTRQLGGYTGADGRKVKKNVILRTGMLFAAPKETLDELSQKYKVSDIIDFRMPPEIATMPEPEVKGAKYHHISVLNNLPYTEEDFNLYKSLIGVEDVVYKYSKMYYQNFSFNAGEVYELLAFGKDGKAGYKEFFDIALNKPDDAAILFHCTQGKDRTGMAAILLLTALGVDRETVTQEYLLTNTACKPLLDKIKNDLTEANADPKVTDFALFLEGVSRPLVDPIFDRMCKEYGSVLGYIEKELGLTTADLKKLQDLYLTN